MKYQELMDTCSDIWRKYGNEGNSYLGLSVAREYCVRHLDECEDATPEQIANIKKWDEYKKWQDEIKREKHKEEILNNQNENPKEYQKFLKMKKKYEV